MNVTDLKVEFSESDFQEVFALFPSPSAYELGQVYDPRSEHYFERADLSEDYNLSYEKREFAIDALRASLAFLHRHGYPIEKDGEVISLEDILEHFAE
jgi:hypothetical protein